MERSHLGSGSAGLLLLTPSTISTAGYVVGWKYRAIGEGACPTYASIWRKSKEHYYLLTETKLRPLKLDYAVLRYQFQYQYDSTIKINIGDIIGVRSIDEVGCSRNLVSYTTKSTSIGRTAIYTKTDEKVIAASSTTEKSMTVDIKAFVAGELFHSIK